MSPMKSQIKFTDAKKLKKSSAFQLDKDMAIGEIMEKSSQAVEYLGMYGLHCATCFASNFDTLKEGAQVHGMTDEELETMIEEINIELAKKEHEKNK